MPQHRLHLATAPGMPLPTLKRRLGVTNVGLYCNACGEFYAFGVEVPDDQEIEFTADGPVLTRCPFCETEEDRRVGEIERLVLTEGKKKRHVA
ncbi:hypothetical protein EKPJFOCH_2464 [Methylobacterium thuringiense]|uniref:Rubredoxin n=2 Tax=Methylobacteriaceae TaxID=119045 RepID=A0ABQ4TMX1_9HYPH|nr:hypothetical protein EKPJFOCH_2464 [Methylobacterium thuringiense]